MVSFFIFYLERSVRWFDCRLRAPIRARKNHRKPKLTVGERSPLHLTLPCMLGLVSDARITLQFVHRLRQASARVGVEASTTASLDNGVAT
jgi:hypothetical protein